MKEYLGRRGRLGQAPVALIIFIVLTLAAAAGCYVLYQQLSAKQDELASARVALEDAQRKLDTRSQDLADLQQKTGWQMPDQINPLLEPQKARPAPTGAPQQILHKRLANARELVEQLLTMNEQYYGMLVEKQQALDREKEQRLAAEADRNMMILAREKEIQIIRDELAAEMQRLEQARDEAKGALAQQTEGRVGDIEARAQLEADLAKTEEDLAQAHKTLASLTERLHELYAKEKELALVADGKIVSVSREFGFAFIDLGRVDGLSPGLKFTVFRDIATGPVVVGQVEVRRVDERTSQVAITKQELSQPIIEGDMIANVAFDKERTVVFTFAGELEKYSLEQAQRIIARYGAETSETITPHVSYLVVGKDPGEALEKARDLGVPIMTEERFLNFVGRPY